MTTDELIIDFNLKYQNFGTQSYNRLLNEHIIWLLNYTSIQYVKEMCSLKPERKVQYLPSNVLDNIKPLISRFSQTISVGTDSEATVALPDDYMFIVPQSGRCNTTFKGRTFTSVPCRLVDYENIYDVIHDYMSTPVYNSPVASIVSEGITVYSRNIRPTEKFSITNFGFKYIKKLAKITTMTTSVLPEHVHPDLVDQAVIIARRLVDTNQLDQMVNQPLDME